MRKNLLLACCLWLGIHCLHAQKPVKNYIEKGFMDTTVHPATDFYRYANGNWLKNTALPPDGYVMTMTDLLAQNDQTFAELMKRVLHTPNPNDRKERLLSDFYKSAVDTVASPKNSLSYIRQQLADIEALPSMAAFGNYLVKQSLAPSHKIVGLKGNPYNEASPIVEAEYVQSGLPLPAAFYTIRTDGNDAVLKRYQDFLSELFVSVGASSTQAEKQAREVVALESRLARSHDTVAHPEKRRLPQLQAKCPNVPWAKFADKYQLPAATVYQVYHPAYYDTLNKLLKTVPLSVWKQKAKADYLLFNAPRLSNKTARQHFELFEITVRKAEKTYSREDQARELMENFYSAVNLADVSGDIFARSVLGKEDKAKMNQMAEHIRRVFLSRLGQNRWLSPQAKAKAIRKLQAMIFKVGYPKKTAGESLLFTPDNYAKNYALLYAERQKAYLLSLGKPKPRGQWQRNQWSIAGSYQSETNSFEIVSGLLQPPFFQKGADDAVLYGTVGSIIAHEITHGLDNNGKDYNETGVKENWWTAADTLNFNKLTQPLAEQFSSYLVMDNTYLNGKITLGENIADLVGLQVAYEAFTQSSQFRDNKNIDGFTPTQRFLIAFAQQWRSKYTDQILKEYFLSDVHPPDNLRVNGTLSNFEPFYKSFNVQPAHALYRPQLVRIW